MARQDYVRIESPDGMEWIEYWRVPGRRGWIVRRHWQTEGGPGAEHTGYYERQIGRKVANAEIKRKRQRGRWKLTHWPK